MLVQYSRYSYPYLEVLYFDSRLKTSNSVVEKGPLKVHILILWFDSKLAELL
jgi:hypothetical protein